MNKNLLKALLLFFLMTGSARAEVITVGSVNLNLYEDTCLSAVFGFCSFDVRKRLDLNSDASRGEITKAPWGRVHIHWRARLSHIFK